jgi:hypothetical protein
MILYNCHTLGKDNEGALIFLSSYSSVCINLLRLVKVLQFIERNEVAQLREEDKERPE